MSDDLLRHPVHSGHLLIGALKRHRDKPVLHLGDTTLTGGQLAERVSQYIQAFDALGAGSGAVAGFLSLNRPEVLMITSAGQTQGYRRLALHPLGSLDDHAYVLTDSGATSLIIDPNPMFVERAIGLLGKVPALQQVLTIGPVPPELAATGAKCYDLTAEAAKYEPEPLTAANLAPDYVNGLSYTGGTTGKPKGVMMTTQATTTMTTIQLAEWEWPENPRFLMLTPLSHAGAAYFLPTVIKGGELHVMAKFDPAAALEYIEKHRITATFVVPAMLYTLMDHPDSHTRDLSSLETVYYGASAINPVRLAEAIERFGHIFAQNYGQSEAPMAISYLGKKDHDAKRLSSCGRPTLFARCALLGPDDNPVPQGEVGEVCVSGPLLSGGYWKLPDETAKTYRDGWLRTGDMAREDEDGFWFIVDRVKDVIVTGGFNVYPREVEDVVAEHPSVAQVCVVGAPDEKWGEIPVAVVAISSDQLRIEDLDAFLDERLARYKHPKVLEIVEALPRNPAGKVLKTELRKQYAEPAE